MLLFKLPLTGTRRVTTKFAFLPTRLGRGESVFNSGAGGDIVWLEKYLCEEEHLYIKETMSYGWKTRERRRKL